MYRSITLIAVLSAKRILIRPGEPAMPRQEVPGVVDLQGLLNMSDNEVAVLRTDGEVHASVSLLHDAATYTRSCSGTYVRRCPRGQFLQAKYCIYIIETFLRGQVATMERDQSSCVAESCTGWSALFFPEDQLVACASWLFTLCSCAALALVYPFQSLERKGFGQLSVLRLKIMLGADGQGVALSQHRVEQQRQDSSRKSHLRYSRDQKDQCHGSAFFFSLFLQYLYMQGILWPLEPSASDCRLNDYIRSQPKKCSRTRVTNLFGQPPIQLKNRSAWRAERLSGRDVTDVTRIEKVRSKDSGWRLLQRVSKRAVRRLFWSERGDDRPLRDVSIIYYVLDRLIE